jgi:Tol biopolymer transport system component
MKSTVLILTLLATCALSAPISYAQCSNNPVSASNNSFPTAITGKLVYHSYVSYGDGSSQLWVYDFNYHLLTQISNSSWGISDPMNAVWSPDGNWLLFMGIQNNAWNLFAWPTNNAHTPYNLTHSTGATRNEDPKFSADGSRIVFKQNFGNSYAAPFNVVGGVPSLGTLTNLTNNSLEDSMPFLTPNNNNLLFAVGSGSALQIYYKNLQTSQTVSFAKKAYYPIVRSDATVFYADTSSGNDQTAYKISPTANATQANFNDCQSDNSDAWPVNGSNLAFFSGSQMGNYQIFLGDLVSGARWSLTPLGINSDTTRSYLGAAYRGN